MGQLGNLESCVVRFVGPAVLAEVGKMFPSHESACSYIYDHCGACMHMLL